jgi:hypothetical protein
VGEAEEAYRLASQHGRRVQPGLALLRLAQGDAGAALASLRRALEESPERRYRPMLLAACVEAGVGAGEVGVARAAAEELAGIADDDGVPYLRALAGRAMGAERIWRELEAPYEAARTRILIGRVYGDLADGAEADMSLTAAATVFEQLGAAADLTLVERARGAGLREA